MTSPDRRTSTRHEPPPEPWLARLLAPRSTSLAAAPRAAVVSPGAEPLAAGDGSIGVLLCHGFTGSPVSMRPWGEHLVDAGFRVRIPRLPGHGTSWQEMNQTTWPDWYAHVEAECRLLIEECEVVVLGGLSMGGALALRLAAAFGDRIAGLALVNPAVTSADKRMAAVPVLKLLTASIGAIGDDIAKPGISEQAYDRTPLRALASMLELWRVVGAQLDQVSQPLLLLISDEDHVVDPSSSKLIGDRVASSDVTRVRLERSYHVATLDYDAPLVFAASTEFFRRAAATRSSATTQESGGLDPQSDLAELD